MSPRLSSRLVPERPVTIERWFPYLYRLSDGMLLMARQHGVDHHFSPWFRTRSVDGGRTWTNPANGVRLVRVRLN